MKTKNHKKTKEKKSEMEREMFKKEIKSDNETNEKYFHQISYHEVYKLRTSTLPERSGRQ